MVEGKGFVTRCTILRITRKNRIGRIDTYLENIYTTVNWN